MSSYYRNNPHEPVRHDWVTSLGVAQRSYDHELPEPEGKFVCRECGQNRWDSERAEKNLNVCGWCEEESNES